MEKTKNVKSIVDKLDRDDLVIYIGNGVEVEECSHKYIVLVSHEFSRSGAPTVLLEMAKVLRERGISVWVLCTEEGPIMEQFIEIGSNVIIYKRYLDDIRWLRCARKSFDLWCVNTLVLIDTFRYLNKMNANVIWWVHEGEGWFELYKNLLPHMELNVNSKILAAGPYVQRMFKQYMGKAVDILNFVVDDVGISLKQREKSQKIRFLQAGTIDGNKRQGLFAEALELIPNEVREASEFVFCGNRERANQLEIAKIDRVVERYNNVRLIPQVDRKTLFQMYEDIDVVVVPSFIETTSAIMVEAMMKGKFGICSSTCGIKEYIDDRKNGFIFESGNAQDLADKISYVVNNFQNLECVGVEARKVYEQTYSKEVFSKRIDEILDWAEQNRTSLSNESVVSIVVYTCNSKQRLIYTIQSLYNQTYNNIEIIVIDDASTDDTMLEIEKLFGTKENLVYLVNDEYVGKGGAFNAAIECCKGEYISFTEAGDEWLPDKLENQLEILMTNKDCDGTYSYAQVLENAEKYTVYPRIQRGNNHLSSNIQTMMMRDSTYVCIGTILFKKKIFECIDIFRDDLDNNASYEFLFREMKNINVYGLSEVTMITRNHPISSANIEDFIRANCLILINQLEDIKESGYMEMFYAGILKKMEEVGVNDVFVEILRDNASDVLQVYGEHKRININMNACSACGACENVCPVGAITLEVDEKGFLYPSIDRDKCINCDKCVKVCSVNYDIPKPEIQQEIYAVKRNDENKRMESQSGGAFSALAEAVLNADGVVYGAGFDEELNVVYLRVDNKEELIKLKGSKYVQARVGNAFALVKEDLQAGKKVLFSGTACHVDGLKHYIGDNLGKNLFTCDLVCHGVPSPIIYQDYLRYISGKNGKIKSFNFRNKYLKGWHEPVETWINDAGMEFSSKDYTQLFYSRLGFRESCYTCKYANMNRISDITVGDFWGIEKTYPDMDDGKGVSLMLINSAKGKLLFNEIQAGIEYRVATASQCRQHNLVAPSSKPAERAAFWNDYGTKDFRYILRAYANEYYAMIANKIVLSSWENLLATGKSISTYLFDNCITKVAVCGESSNNKLIINDLKRDLIQITAEINLYVEKASDLKEIEQSVELSHFVEELLEDTDAIIISDETHCVDIIDKLYEAGVPLTKILPLSFIVMQEV